MVSSIRHTDQATLQENLLMAVRNDPADSGPKELITRALHAVMISN
jgi:hypothetical protein